MKLRSFHSLYRKKTEKNKESNLLNSNKTKKYLFCNQEYSNIRFLKNHSKEHITKTAGLPTKYEISETTVLSILSFLSLYMVPCSRNIISYFVKSINAIYVYFKSQRVVIKLIKAIVNPFLLALLILLCYICLIYKLSRWLIPQSNHFETEYRLSHRFWAIF